MEKYGDMNSRNAMVKMDFKGTNVRVCIRRKWWPKPVNEFASMDTWLIGPTQWCWNYAFCDHQVT